MSGSSIFVNTDTSPVNIGDNSLCDFRRHEGIYAQDEVLLSGFVRQNYNPTNKPIPETTPGGGSDGTMLPTKTKKAKRKKLARCGTRYFLRALRRHLGSAVTPWISCCHGAPHEPSSRRSILSRPSATYQWLNSAPVHRGTRHQPATANDPGRLATRRARMSGTVGGCERLGSASGQP